MSIAATSRESVFARYPLLTFVSGVCSFALIAVLGGWLHPWPFSSNDSAPTMSDLLVTAIAISGVTVPVLVTYLSLGRIGDVLSEIGDSIPFFMSKANLQKTDLDAALTMAAARVRIGQEVTTAELGCIGSLKELLDLGMASGDLLNSDTKMLLVPKNYHRDFLTHLHSGHDRRFLRLFAEIVGVCAVLCILCLYSGHFGDDGPRSAALHEVFFWTEHALCTFTLILNVAAYCYLVRIARVRATVQASTFRHALELCLHARNIYRKWDGEAKAVNSEELRRAREDRNRRTRTPPTSPKSAPT